MKRHTWILLLAVAACGGNEPAPTPAADANPTPPAAPEEAAAEKTSLPKVHYYSIGPN